MAIGVSSLLVCLVVEFLSHSQGLQFTLDSNPDTFYCAHLHCSVDVNQNDPSILSVVGLTISSIVQSNTLIRLASVSAVDVEPHVEATKIHDLNATGSVTRYHANLDLSLHNETDCLMTSFLCELDFTNVNGDSDKIREVVTRVDTTNCDDVDRKLTDLDVKLTAMDGNLTELTSQNAAMDGKLTELTSQNAAMDGKLTELTELTEQELMRLETKLDSVIGYLTRLEALINASQPIDPYFKCDKGAPSDVARKKFLLWGRVKALCDTETDGGGWVIIQRRRNGDVDFSRGWDDYKKGFGTPDTDYWLGNDNIRNMTSEGYTNLRVDMEYQGVNYFAEYSTFSVADEISKYKLTVGGYHGNATGQFSYNSGMFFSTIDRDNDQYNGTCANSDSLYGAWWHKACTNINLNGMWGAQNQSGLFWAGVVYPGSVAWSEMKIRKV